MRTLAIATGSWLWFVAGVVSAAISERSTLGEASPPAELRLFQWIFVLVWLAIFLSPVWLKLVARITGRVRGRILGIPYDMRTGHGRSSWGFGGGGYGGGFSSGGGGGGFGGGGGAGSSW